MESCSSNMFANMFGQHEQQVRLGVDKSCSQTCHTCSQTCTLRFDCVKYADAEQLGRAASNPNSGTAAYGIGCIMLIFRIVHADLKPEGYRDFALVCIMQVANRSAAGPFPRFDSENRCEGAHLDDPNTNHKLGRLWTWKLLREQRTYRVLSANEILETVAIMPRFQQGSEKWSISTGVYENRYLLDSRARPPFRSECPCAAGQVHVQ